jgi:hypothetical protein
MKIAGQADKFFAGQLAGGGPRAYTSDALVENRAPWHEISRCWRRNRINPRARVSDIVTCLRLHGRNRGNDTENLNDTDNRNKPSADTD